MFIIDVKIMNLKSVFISIFLFAIVLTNFSSAESQDERERSRSAYSRLVESAHPLPAKTISPRFLRPLAPETDVPLFLNVNTSGHIYGQPGEQMQNESSIAVNPTNPNILIASAVDYRESSSTWVYVSKDGGITWENLNLGKPYSNWRSTNDPSVAFDTEGVGYLVYGGFGYDEFMNATGENGVFMARTFDDGQTWEPHIEVIVHTGEQTPDSSFEDKYYISVDNSPESDFHKNLYIPWKRVTNRDSATQIVVVRSTNKGSDWSDPVPVSDRLPGSSEDTTFGQSFPLITTGPEGQVYLVWNHGIEHGVGFAKSYDGGEQWTDPRIIHNYDIFGETIFIEGQGWRHSVKGAVRAEAYPSIVCDITDDEDRRGNLYLVWAADNPPNIYFSRSEDEGENWTEPKLVHSVEKNDQFWPWIAIDPTNGDLAVMYLDSRNDPENFLVDCFVSYSSDAGETWIDREASDFSGDLTRNPFRGNAFAGDYSGAAFYDGMIYPSWIDMRNTQSSIFNSDVFTAIINVNAPLPPKNFKSEIFADESGKVELTWDIPAELSFGAPVEADNLKYRLFRGDEFLAELPGETKVYEDNGLQAHELYEYKIRAFVADDTSAAAICDAMPGGSRLPAAPDIISSRGTADNKAILRVKTPEFRADGTTPLVNLKELRIYVDSTFLEARTIESVAPGAVVELEIEGDRGWRLFNVSAADDEQPANESDLSAPELVYSGRIDNDFFDNFDGDRLANYYNPGGWGLVEDFYYSAPHSINESPSGDYDRGAEYPLYLYPIEATAERVNLHFVHSCFVHKRDVAVVEFSTDAEIWTEIARFIEGDYPAWEDGERNEDDWKFESFEFDVDPGDTVYVRFAMRATGFLARDGWYLDDVRIDFLNSITELSDESTIVYPNPANRFVTVRIPGEFLFDREIKIVDVFGSVYVPEIASIGENEIVLDLGGFDSGLYLLKINTGSENYSEKVVLVK